MGVTQACHVSLFGAPERSLIGGQHRRRPGQLSPSLRCLPTTVLSHLSPPFPSPALPLPYPCPHSASAALAPPVCGWCSTRRPYPSAALLIVRLSAPPTAPTPPVLPPRPAGLHPPVHDRRSTRTPPC